LYWAFTATDQEHFNIQAKLDPLGEFILFTSLDQVSINLDDTKEFNLQYYAIPSTNLIATASPIPTALPLFSTGLGAMGLLGWRRKRKLRLGGRRSPLDRT
jgi:hypothetical protein